MAESDPGADADERDVDGGDVDAADGGATSPPSDGSDGEPNAEVPADVSADVQAELAVLREENERLRAAYASAKRSRHRQTALGFALIGLLALSGAALLPAVRTVLLALAGTGLFAAVLTVYLTPERFVAASVGRSVYEAMADSEAAVVAELGLADERVYVPVESEPGVRLFVPQHADRPLPAASALADAFVVPDGDATRGLALDPTGVELVEEVDQATSGGLPAEPDALASSLREALREQLELVDAATVEVEPGRATLAVTDSAFGPCHRFDHPVPSTFVCGLARGLDVPVEMAVRASADARADWQVTCRWEADGDAEEESENTERSPDSTGE